ncbi:hypothetical protein AADG42_09030 [Ammonicoccus fulvus]|uniref:Uncharacterized protein n=1 Tax=Ammonicoccus fulvus TaxID=3138240 RepID=A0ABZ3FRQ5_9ACTN
MSRKRPNALAFAESPAQLLNALEWAYAENARAYARLVVLGPGDPTTRFQLHRLSDLARADGFEVVWAEVRRGAGTARELARLARQVRGAAALVIGDPYSGMIQLLLNGVAPTTRLVVVDDGTATLRYAEQWERGEELKRWHLDRRGVPSRITGFRATRLLGHRSDRVELFTAMPVTAPIPMRSNTYEWVRQRFAIPAILPGTDLMGTSLVETGVIDESAYLTGVARLVTERAVTRYLPHRREAPAKLAAIERLGVRIVTPDLPMEVYARRGPIGQSILSFPSTVLHTLPLVLAGTDVSIEALSVDDDWFVAGARDEERAFVRGI